VTEHDDDEDQVIVSATYRPADRNEGDSPTLHIRLGPLISFSEPDAELRQSRFENALDELRERFRALIVERPDDQRPFRVDVSVSLVPLSGQAGIVLTDEATKKWQDCAVDFYIDALG